MSPKMNTSNLLIVSWSVGIDGELQTGHVGPSEKHVGAGLHQRVELQVGVLGQKAIDQRAVLGPQRPLDVQHVHPRLDDRGHDRSLIVLHDLLFGHRRNADRVGVAAFDGGAKLEA